MSQFTECLSKLANFDLAISKALETDDSVEVWVSVDGIETHCRVTKKKDVASKV